MGWKDDPVIGGKSKWESDPIVSSAHSVSQEKPAAPMIDIRAGVAVPILMPPSANPYSAGRYPLSRIFTVGDAVSYRRSDILTGLEEPRGSMRVTRVNYDEDRVEYNNGGVITDLMGNLIKEGAIRFNVPRQWTPAEFHIGRKWSATARRTEKGQTGDVDFDLQIVKRETISVPAGSFDTFRIEGQAIDSFGTRSNFKQWLVPKLNFLIKLDQVNVNRSGGFHLSRRWELVSMRQQTVDMT